MKLKDFILVCGHYGSGKTNFAINLAIDIRKQGKKVTIVDMDLVNPYFRTSDYRSLLEEHDIRVIAPTYGATNLDIPSLPAEMYSIFEGDSTIIVDVGGDDVGATVLGRFYTKIKDMDYDLLYVVNKYRNLTATPEEATEVLREIEAVSRLKATGIVNNSHLKQETTEELIMDSCKYAADVSEMTGLPVVCTAVRRDIAEKIHFREVYPVDIMVCTVWEQAHLR